MKSLISKKDLFNFIDRAGKATYAGGGKYEKNPQREGFFELVYLEGDLEYRDSYTGHSRSGGQEVVRQKGKPVWWSGYGGGMVLGKEGLSNLTFEFLKKALAANENGFISLRGPHQFVEGDWKYIYTQEGDVTDFYGYEEIYYKGKRVFWHRAVGGIINGK